MKIILCGPPHSGKSVFVVNLLHNLPTDSSTTIRACPDGEGTWSNNKKQTETTLVRQKGKFTREFVENACQAIDNQISKIVLVDVGGIMSPENEEIFKHCDAFIVVSSDEEKKKEWVAFGDKLGLRCLGSIDSKLEGTEEIYEREPYLQGRIVGLERGEILQNSSIIHAMVSDIVQRSGYAEKREETNLPHEGVWIDDTNLGFELGYGREAYTEDGTPIRIVRWPESALLEIQQAIREKAKRGEPLKINGVRANFALCSMCLAAREKGVSSISAFDIRSKEFVPIHELPKEEGIKETTGLRFHTIESKESVFLDVDIVGDQFYSMGEYEKCILPQIAEGKNLYLSGRIPLWLLASMCMSYDAKKIHTFQPGKGFTIVSSTDEKEVGTVVEGVEEIDINQYFEDKKQGKISPSPEKYILSETTKINQKDNDSQDTGEIE